MSDDNTGASPSDFSGSAADLANSKLRQELKNLQLEEEKLGKEIADLSRPYFLRYPQLLTAVLTIVAGFLAAIGAIIGYYQLAKDNYYKNQALLNTLTENETKRIQSDAKKATADADKAKAEADKEKADADKEKTEAATAKAGAKADQEKATAIKLEAATQIERYKGQVSEAEAAAQRSIVDAEALQRHFVSALGVPASITRNSRQIASLDVRFPLSDLSWLPTSLEELRVIITPSTNLRDIPAGVEHLTLEKNRYFDFDLRQVPSGILSLTLLDQAFYSRPRPSGSSVSPTKIVGLTRLDKLQEFSSESLDFVAGLEQLASMPNCQNISLSVPTLARFPEALAKRVRKLSYGRLFGPSPADVALISQMTNLEDLDIDDASLLALTKNLPNLKKLSFRGEITDDNVALIAGGTTVSDLKLVAYDIKITDTIHVSFPNLKKLELHSSFRSGRVDKLLTLFPSAELTLWLDSEEMSEATVKWLGQLPNLRVLHLFVNQDWAIPVSDLKGLEEIDVVGPNNGRDLVTVDVNSLLTLPRLKRLRLRNIASKLDIGGLQDLEALDIPWSTTLSLECSRPLKKLRSLSIEGPRENCDRWSELFTKCTSGADLRSLTLSGAGCQPVSLPGSVDHLTIVSTPEP